MGFWQFQRSHSGIILIGAIDPSLVSMFDFWHFELWLKDNSLSLDNKGLDVLKIYVDVKGTSYKVFEQRSAAHQIINQLFNDSLQIFLFFCKLKDLRHSLNSDDTKWHLGKVCCTNT